MKNILIMGASALAFYFVMRQAVPAAVGATRGGARIMGTDGKAYTLEQDKNGFMRDQFGGMWT